MPRSPSFVVGDVVKYGDKEFEIIEIELGFKVRDKGRGKKKLYHLRNGKEIIEAYGPEIVKLSDKEVKKLSLKKVVINYAQGKFRIKTKSKDVLLIINEKHREKPATKRKWPSKVELKNYKKVK